MKCPVGTCWMVPTCTYTCLAACFNTFAYARLKYFDVKYCNNWFYNYNRIPAVELCLHRMIQCWLAVSSVHSPYLFVAALSVSSPRLFVAAPLFVSSLHLFVAAIASLHLFVAAPLFVASPHLFRLDHLRTMRKINNNIRPRYNNYVHMPVME